MDDELEHLKKHTIDEASQHLHKAMICLQRQLLLDQDAADQPDLLGDSELYRITAQIGLAYIRLQDETQDRGWFSNAMIPPED